MKIKKLFLSHQSTKNLISKIFVTLVGASVSFSAFSQEEIGVAAAVNTTTTDNFYDESGMFEERRLVEERVTKSFKTEPSRPMKKEKPK